MRITIILTCVIVLCGCGRDDSASQPIKTDSGLRDPSTSNYSYNYDEIANIVFLDEVATNTNLALPVTQLTFKKLDGAEVAVEEYVKDKSLVVVVTRGNTQPVCPYCTTQVARLINRYAEIAALNAEVITVYPVELNSQEKIEEFLAEANSKVEGDKSIPFPILLDVDLKGVDALGIRKDLSKPATYIVDRDGTVRFAYVGANRADRPSVDGILNELKKINSEVAPDEL